VSVLFVGKGAGTLKETLISQNITGIAEIKLNVFRNYEAVTCLVHD
jgi:hypothetical protein